MPTERSALRAVPDAPEERRADLLPTALMMSLTLGLAPFVPEPHLVEKLRWLAQGGAGMRPLDVFDLIMHGAPWLALAWLLVQRLRIR
jgi:hypothetical protein